MKVVVCDDNIDDLKNIKGLLTKYKKLNKDVQLETEYFTDSAELYRQIQAKAHSDIYILDMIMSKRTGIDIGTLIRNTDKNNVIIYITSSDDFAFEAFCVHAARYLLKPVQEELFIEALDCAVSGISKKTKNPMYTVKTKEGLVSIPYSGRSNMIVNTMLCYMMEKAHSLGIKVQQNISVSKEIPVNDYEFAMVIANLFDNAFDCIKNFTDREKFMDAKIHCEKDYLLIHMKNEYEKEIIFDSETGLPQSRKGTKHGFGLQSVQDFSDKIGGNLGCYCEDDMFHILLYAKFQVL